MAQNIVTLNPQTLQPDPNGVQYVQYTTPSGSVVTHLYQPNAIPSEPTLGDAQAAQIASLQASYNAALAAGFSSTATGSAVTYGFAPSDQQNMNLISEAIDRGIEQFPIPYGDVHGTVVNITDAATWNQICKDADTFKWSQVGKIRSLIRQVQTATDIPTVQTIVWE